MATNLENIVDRLADDGSSSDIPRVGGNENNLEDVVRNHRRGNVFGDLLNYMIGGTAIAVSYSFAGPISLFAGATATLGDYIITKVRKRDYPSRQFRNAMMAAGVYGYLGSTAFNWMNSTFDVTKITGMLKRAVVQLFGYAPAMGIIYNTLMYPLENRTIRRLPRIAWRELWFKNYKANLKYFAVPEMLVARFAPPWIHFPLAIIGGLLWRTTFGSRRVRIVDPYIYEHKKIQGKSVYELGKQYGVTPGQDRIRSKILPLDRRGPYQGQELDKAA